MTRSIKDVVYELLGHSDDVEIGNGYHDECKADADRYLKELEAIMQGVIDTGKVTGSSRGEENIGSILSTISVVTRQQRQALLAALYGKEG